MLKYKVEGSIPFESKFSNLKSLFFEQAFNSCPADIYYLSLFKFPSFKKNVKCLYSSEKGGAVEACWAHNPVVGGSKPLLANAIKPRENLCWIHKKLFTLGFCQNRKFKQ